MRLKQVGSGTDISIKSKEINHLNSGKNEKGAAKNVSARVKVRESGQKSSIGSSVVEELFKEPEIRGIDTIGYLEDEKNTVEDEKGEINESDVEVNKEGSDINKYLIVGLVVSLILLIVVSVLFISLSKREVKSEEVLSEDYILLMDDIQSLYTDVNHTELRDTVRSETVASLQRKVTGLPDDKETIADVESELITMAYYIEDCSTLDSIDNFLKAEKEVVKVKENLNLYSESGLAVTVARRLNSLEILIERSKWVEKELDKWKKVEDSNILACDVDYYMDEVCSIGEGAVSLLDKVVDIEEKQKEVKNVESTMSKEQASEKEDLEKSIENLTKDLELKVSELDKATIKIQDLEKDLKGKNKDVKNLESKNKSLQQNVDDLNAEKLKLSNEIINLNVKIKELESSVTNRIKE